MQILVAILSLKNYYTISNWHTVVPLTIS
uniref:Uncharacterized protein n=1 Tax=Arundo donax TaxID=35708 RepID=A0A0A9HC63_ARUDO